MNNLSTLVMAFCAIGIIPLSASSAEAQSGNEPIVIIEGGLVILDDYSDQLLKVVADVADCDDFAEANLQGDLTSSTVLLQTMREGMSLAEQIVLQLEGNVLDESMQLEDIEAASQESLSLLRQGVDNVRIDIQDILDRSPIPPDSCTAAQVGQFDSVFELGSSGLEFIANGFSLLAEQPLPIEEPAPLTIVVITPGTAEPGCEETQECYVPSNIQVTPGSIITWVNSDNTVHTVTAGSPDTGPVETFYSPLIAVGQVYEFTFNEEGTYEYFCLIHQWMRGTVEVSASMASDADESGAMMEDAAPDLTVDIPDGTAVPGCEADNECYLPFVAEVSAGDTIQWINSDTVPHTVTAGGPDGGATEQFYSSLLFQNETFEYTFDEPGTYDYYCLVHPWMLGSVQVN